MFLIFNNVTFGCLGQVKRYNREYKMQDIEYKEQEEMDLNKFKLGYQDKDLILKSAETSIKMSKLIKEAEKILQEFKQLNNLVEH